MSTTLALSPTRAPKLSTLQRREALLAAIRALIAEGTHPTGPALLTRVSFRTTASALGVARGELVRMGLIEVPPGLRMKSRRQPFDRVSASGELQAEFFGGKATP